MKKYIILCEGKHDAAFLSLLMDNYDCGKYEVFHLRENQENNTGNTDKDFTIRRRNNREATKLRNFKKRSNKNVVLIKDEGDQDDCIEQFFEIVNDFNSTDDIYITLLLDYDNENIWHHLGNNIESYKGKKEILVFRNQYVKEHDLICDYLDNCIHRLVVYPHKYSMEVHIREITGIDIDKKGSHQQTNVINKFYSNLESEFIESIHTKIFERSV